MKKFIKYKIFNEEINSSKIMNKLMKYVEFVRPTFHSI